MTSISSTQFVQNSPRVTMDARISAAVSAGTISSTDETALEKALDSIDTSLSASRTSGQRPSGDMKTRMDDLIDQQVESGTLTEDQAAELKTLFAQGPDRSDRSQSTSETQTADADESVEGVGVKGRCGPGGPPPPRSDSAADEEGESSTDQLAEATSRIDALMAFLEKLRESVSSGLYGQTTASTSSSNAGLVVDTAA